LPELLQTQQTVSLISSTGLRQLRSIQEDPNECKFNSDKFQLPFQQLSAPIQHIRGIEPKSALPHHHQPPLPFQIHFGHWFKGRYKNIRASRVAKEALVTLFIKLRRLSVRLKPFRTQQSPPEFHHASCTSNMRGAGNGNHRHWAASSDVGNQCRPA
jgi:hypothetical protein